MLGTILSPEEHIEVSSCAKMVIPTFFVANSGFPPPANSSLSCNLVAVLTAVRSRTLPKGNQRRDLGCSSSKSSVRLCLSVEKIYWRRLSHLSSRAAGILDL